MEKELYPLMEYKPMVYNPNENGMVSWKIIFGSGNGHGNR